MSEDERETWTSRVGFLIAAIGSAVGLGNIWQFPFKTAANGGAAFVVFYLLAVLLLGFPALLAEFALGRRTHSNAIDAFEEMGHRSWRVVGALSVVTGFWILSYYDVVGGWVLRYMIGSATGAYFDAPGEFFGSIATGPEAIAGQAVFIGLVVGIVALGVADGIERATKVMVPAIVVLMIGLAAWAFTLGGAAEGYAYFLSPDFGDLLANAPSVIPYAVSQAFFTLSLGMAIMITYSSYVGEDDSLAVDGGVIVVSNTLIGVLAGLVVFPIMFAIGADPTQTTTDALFVAVASAFAQLPLGNLLGVVFFGVVLMAALSSAISLLEVLVAYAADNYDVARTRLAVAAGVLLFLLGLPSAWSSTWFGWFDSIAYGLFLPLSVLFVVIFVSWVIGREAVDELRRGTTGAAWFGPVWLWTTRIVVLVGILVALAFGVTELFLADNAAFFAPF